MQSFLWYYNRIKSMSSAEILWRFTSIGKGAVDHVRVASGILPKPTVVKGGFQQPEFRLAHVPIGSISDELSSLAPVWSQVLCEKADEIKSHKLSFFNLDKQFLGDPIDWHSDHSSMVRGAVAPIASVNYRDFNNYGDCKLVWEPNRHHHLVVLARAYRATGQQPYAQAVIDQLGSWLDGNPVGKGMNWRSPLELGIRLINWVWAIDYIWESGLVAGEFKEKLICSVYLHCRDIARKFSRGSSANNHLVGEAAGVYIAASYFNCFKESSAWIDESKAILENEIIAQSYDDGCTREQAFGYQFFVLQFYLFSGLVGKVSSSPFSEEYWERYKHMLNFVARVAQSGSMPMFGDKDDGYVLDLGESVDDVAALVEASGRVIGARINDFTPAYNSEMAFWIAKREVVKEGGGDRTLPSLEFEDSGYYLLQSGVAGDEGSVSVVFDCGDLGYQSIAAHGHADALSFTMSLGGKDFLVDSGTYDYFTYPAWRNYFRSTRAHNTVEIDGLDQSENLGPFMWGYKAQSRCTEWLPSKSGGLIQAEHNGYTRLDSPVVHRRCLDLNSDKKRLIIQDTLEGAGEHQAVIYFHLSEGCEIESIANNSCTVLLNGRAVKLTFDNRMVVSAISGSESPIAGWLSRGYHQKTAVVTLSAPVIIRGGGCFKTVVEWA